MEINLRRVARLSAAVVASVFATGIAVAAPASATSESVSAQTCWLNADTGAFACFDSEEAFESASDVVIPGDVALPRQVAPQPAAASATYLLATFYQDASWGGSTVNITTSHAALCTGYHYYGSSMPSGWNDRVSSFRAYGTCAVELYHDSGYGGSTFGPYTSAASVGSMNDESSSYQIFATN